MAPSTPSLTVRSDGSVTSRVVLGGIALFVVGLGFIVADVVPFFLGDHNRPVWLNLCCLLAPLGFAIAVWTGIRRGRREQRDALRSLAQG